MHSVTHLQSLFQEYLVKHTFQKSPRQLYEPINYILSLGGKRLRPVLLLMSYNLFDQQIEKALHVAFAIEVFHNFTLMHDDIMDAAPLRRNKPTVHYKYNVNTGILSGDAMLIYAYQALSKLENNKSLPEVLETFNRMAIGVCEGQQYDMNFETSTSVEISDYLKMIELKTAVLIAAAMKMGALIAGAAPKDAALLYEFGRNIGIAFQLQDDILDTFGDPEKFGKKVGGDIIQNKKTYLLLKAIELAGREDAEKLNLLMNSPTIEEQNKISAITTLFDKLGVKPRAEALKSKYQSKAFEQLNAVNVPRENKTIIIELAKSLLTRET